MNKSPGPDSVHPRISILYKVRQQSVTPLHILFETSFNSGLIPHYWKFANTVPIHKKGSKADVNNYRPVSLTNVVCKVMESIIGDHIMKYVKNEFATGSQS